MPGVLRVLYPILSSLPAPGGDGKISLKSGCMLHLGRKGSVVPQRDNKSLLEICVFAFSPISL